MTSFKKNCFDRLTSSLGSRACVRNMSLVDALCFIPFNLICNMATFRENALAFCLFDLILYVRVNNFSVMVGLKNTNMTKQGFFYLLITPQGPRVCVSGSMPNSLNNDMCTDYFQKTKCFDLFHPWGRGCFYEQNILYHVAVWVILFNLI